MPTQTQTARRANSDLVHAHRTAKVVELLGSSTKSFDDAIRHSIQDATQTTREITGAHVDGFSVRVRDGKIVEYKVALKVAFGIERTPEP